MMMPTDCMKINDHSVMIIPVLPMYARVWLRGEGGDGEGYARFSGGNRSGWASLHPVLLACSRSGSWLALTWDWVPLSRSLRFTTFC